MIVSLRNSYIIWTALIVLQQLFMGCCGTVGVNVRNRGDRRLSKVSGLDKDTVNTTVVGSFRPIPMYPVRFRYYDRNRDGYVSIQELMSVTGKAENVEKAFRTSDLNGDGWVSKQEYRQVPWGYNRRQDAVLNDPRD